VDALLFTFSGAAILAVAGLILDALNRRDERRRQRDSK
jgi:hypothetical protein